MYILYFIIGSFYPSGEPISLHLLRYRAFAVKGHDFMPCASHLQRSRLVNKASTTDFIHKISLHIHSVYHNLLSFNVIMYTNKVHLFISVSYLNLMQSDLTLQASRSRCICFVTGHSQ